MVNALIMTQLTTTRRIAGLAVRNLLAVLAVTVIFAVHAAQSRTAHADAFTLSDQR
ncbi:MAG: hypothetical protein R3C40_00765 [Parvularculaceae bacterium]